MTFLTCASTKAMARLNASGITLAQAIYMTDSELLRLPSVGRKTLRFVRSITLIEG